MLPDAWLASSALAKVRRKLPDWGRGHLIAYAQQRFGTSDLTKEQLNQLIELLKSGSAVKPEATTAASVPASSGKLMREVALTKNRGALGAATEHYVSGKYVGLRFGNERDLVAWAVGLLWTSKDQWHKVVSDWKKQQLIHAFDPHPGAALAPDLVKLAERRFRQISRETMALPTRPTIRQAFWGFNEGDTLVASIRALVGHHKPEEPARVRSDRATRHAGFARLYHPRRGLTLKVTHVRPNPETAPTVTLTEL